MPGISAGSGGLSPVHAALHGWRAPATRCDLLAPVRLVADDSTVRHYASDSFLGSVGAMPENGTSPLAFLEELPRLVPSEAKFTGQFLECVAHRSIAPRSATSHCDHQPHTIRPNSSSMRSLLRYG